MHLRVTDPLVAWLTYRGVLQSIDSAAPAFMSIWATTASRKSTIPPARWFYEREYLLEITRRTDNPAAVSRLTGLFVFPTRAHADRAVAEWPGFEDYYLNEVEIQPGSWVSDYDADWITSAGQSLDAEASHAYVSGAPRTPSPHTEWLVSGRVNVLGTELRSKARHVVEAEWPESVSMLEVARLGAELSSSIGYIAAYPTSVDDHVHIQYMMDMRDADNTSFTDSLGEHMKRADLAVGGDMFRVPDLSSRTVRIPVADWPW